MLYAPGLSDVEEIRRVVGAVDRPVNAIIMPDGPSVPEFFEAGATRVSLGNWISLAAQAATVDAARELLDHGTHAFLPKALGASRTINKAMSRD